MPSTMRFDALRRRPLRRHPEGDRGALPRPATRRRKTCSPRLLAGPALHALAGQGLPSTATRRALCATPRPATRSRPTPQALKPVRLNNRRPPRRRRRARLADASRRRSAEAHQGRRGGVQVARPRRLAGHRHGLVARERAAPPAARSRPPAPPSCSRRSDARRKRIAWPRCATLAARGDQEAAALLRSLPADTPETVRTAAVVRRRRRSSSRLALWATLQNVAYGISLGSVLLLAAVGPRHHLRPDGRHQHGAWRDGDDRRLHDLRGAGGDPHPCAACCSTRSLFIAVPLAFLVAGAVGVAIERSIIRFLYGRPLETLLATWGLSLILQQAVRSLFGPTNREVGTPRWMSGVLRSRRPEPHLQPRRHRRSSRCAVFAALLLVLRRTPLGLQVRAVTQNRRMAASMGIKTDRIDALTFGLGSGVAGIAGVALSQIDNVSPNLGQSYIIDSFLVVVFGGVGNLWGTLVGALSLGIANKFLEPLPARCSARSCCSSPSSCSSRSVRAACSPSRDGRWKHDDASVFDRTSVVVPDARSRRRRPRAGPQPRRAAGLALPRLRLSRAAPRQVSLLRAPRHSSVDLIWGFCGILSLGHGAFFALGGYAMGMYLMRQIGSRGVYGHPVLPDFMVFLNWKELPWFWHGFDQFWFAALMVLVVPGLLAFVFGWFAFRSRVTGVYLSIITQAMTFALMLAFFRNDMGFGGNNGLTDFKDILGFPVQARSTRAALFCSVSARARGGLSPLPLHRHLEARQGAGRDPRRREPHALPRLPGRELQARRLHALGGARRHRRRALRAAGRHHQSRASSPRPTRSRW